MGGGARDEEEALSAADPFRFTTLAHAGRDLLGPVGPEGLRSTLDRLAEAHAPLGEPRLVDVGCGKGTWLVSALERLGGRGVGVEPNPAFAAEARERIARRLEPGRAAVLQSRLADAALPEQAFTLLVCTGSLHAFGDWAAALRGARALLPAGGLALLGPGYWRRRPEPGYLEVLGGTEDEQYALPRTLGAAEDAGWEVLACRESTTAEWDDYERAYASNVRRWCETHAADPDATVFRERIERWSEGYARWGRDTMGYALLLLRRGG